MTCGDKLLQVYVTGSSIQLGHWKAEDDLKLSYMGDSSWQADCVLYKDEFPVKYPLGLITCRRFRIFFFITFFFLCILVLTLCSMFSYVSTCIFSFFLNIVSTYKYCQKTKAGSVSLEVGPNRELVLDSQSESPPSYISLSDGIFRVKR